MVLLEADEYGEWQTVEIDAVLVLARCRRCKARVRILPADLVPRKTYSWPVIEAATSEYTKFDQSLRKVAWSILGDRTPSHTTLHRWTEGLGAYALGRAMGEVPGATPAARIRSETRARFPGLFAHEEPEAVVPPVRYQSPARLERLVSGSSLLALAGRVTGTQPPHALSAWQRQLLGFSALLVISFRTGLLCTSWQHHSPIGVARCRPSTRKPKEPP